MMTQDGGFFFKKEKKKERLKNTSQQSTTQTLVPSSSTLSSFFAPFACLLSFHQHGLPRENQTPSALHAHPAHRCPVTNRLTPTPRCNAPAGTLLSDKQQQGQHSRNAARKAGPGQHKAL